MQSLMSFAGIMRALLCEDLTVFFAFFFCFFVCCFFRQISSSQRQGALADGPVTNSFGLLKQHIKALIKRITTCPLAGKSGVERVTGRGKMMKMRRREREREAAGEEGREQKEEKNC